MVDFGRGGRFQTPGGRGRMGGPVAGGPDGSCVCPKCGYKSYHAVATPCYNMTCPKCGSKMTRV